MKAQRLAPILLFITVTSCVQNKADSRLAIHAQDQTNTINLLTGNLDKLQTKEISWSKAISRIEKSNHTYLSAKDSRERSYKARNKTWWSLAPQIFTFANVSKSVTELASLSSEDISFSVVANLNIPNPFHFYAQLYADYLGTIYSECALETTRRNLHIKLHTLFSEQKSIDSSLQSLSQISSNLTHLPPFALQAELEKIEALNLRITAKQERLRTQLNQLLNSPSHNWRLSGNPPNISYGKKINSINLESGFGKLGLLLHTLKIESEILQLWNIKMSRWPQISLGASPPSLINSNDNSSQGFDPSQTQLFSGTSYGIQLDDPLKLDHLKDAEARAKYTREELILATEQDASRLRTIKQKYSYLNRTIEKKQTQLRNAQQQLTSLDSPSLIVSQLQDIEALLISVQDLEAQQLQFDYQIWIWDESYWKKF